MSDHYARPLADNQLTIQFLTKVLGYANTADTGDLAVRVANAEVLLSAMTADNTLTSRRYRHPSYCSDEARVQLRATIFKELIDNPRLQNDDDITLGRGGMAPSIDGGAKANRKAFFLIGLPASGKSSISNRIADEYGAYIVDSDYAKRKFPEFVQEYGAAVVHEESTLVTFGLDDSKHTSELNVFGYCVAAGVNLVIPKIGANPVSIRKLRDLLIGYGYEVHLTLVKVDRLSATKRTLSRFCSTKRYVPISLVFDGYSNDPILSYYYMKEDSSWASVGSVSTEQPQTAFIEGTNSNPSTLYK
ncbi:zeta toxin family protein [Burkholderia contaminans]|nr:zeta toxin family protein [Burkholderia contaminans]